jgi:molybdenum cofactor cytidylyltransferase
MIAAGQVVAILLAGGLSSRFGPHDKLAAPLGGMPLGLHAARTLATLPFAATIAVARSGGPDFGACGFMPVVNGDPASGQSGSIRLGLARALVAKPRAVLIALADMPFVTRTHIEALLARLDDDRAIVASIGGRRPGPPALFGAAHFAALAELSGDAGARSLLAGALLVEAPARELVDIDTPGDLARAGAGA